MLLQNPVDVDGQVQRLLPGKVDGKGILQVQCVIQPLNGEAEPNAHGAHHGEHHGQHDDQAQAGNQNQLQNLGNDFFQEFFQIIQDNDVQNNGNNGFLFLTNILFLFCSH